MFLGMRLHVAFVLARIRDVRHLDEALVAFAEDFREFDCGLVVHQIGHHRGAVIVRLNAVLSEALRRPCASFPWFRPRWACVPTSPPRVPSPTPLPAPSARKAGD